MQIYNTTVQAPHHEEIEPVMQVENDGCFGVLPMDPDLIVTQGADLEFRFCGETRADNRPTIACIGETYITITQKACISVGDTIELTCFDDCDVLGAQGIAQHTVTNISADGLRLTITPGFPALTEERCYQATDLLDGCLDFSPNTPAPRLTVLGGNWSLHGIAAHRISNGCVRSIGATTVAGSTSVKTLLIGAVQPDDHVSIPSAGIVDATVLRVRTASNGSNEYDSIELSQAAKVGGCFPALVADGLLVAFEVSADGPCQIARIPASTTSKMKPPHGVEVPATADPMTFLGHYLFVAQTVRLVSGKPVVFTRSIASGLLVLKSTAIGSNRLGV